MHNRVFFRVIDSVKLFARADNLTQSDAIAARRPLGGARPIKPFMVQIGGKWEL